MKRRVTRRLGASEPRSKRSKAREEDKPHRRDLCNDAAQVADCITPIPTGEYSVSFIPTPRNVDESGDVVPPDGWEVNPNYAAIVDPEIPEEAMNARDYNSRVRDIREVAWLLTGISDVKLAVLGDVVLELVHITWSPCWVPIKLVVLDTDQLNVELNREKKAWEKKGPRARKGIQGTIPGMVQKTLALFRLMGDSQYLLRQITKYAVIPSLSADDAESDVEVVRADFKETYEHSTALFLNPELWKELCKRRIEAAEAYLVKNEESPVMKKFLEDMKAKIA